VEILSFANREVVAVSRQGGHVAENWVIELTEADPRDSPFSRPTIHS